MKIAFKIDRVDLFRKGIDAATPMCLLEVNPSLLSEEERELLAKHLLDTDEVCNVVYDPARAEQEYDVVPVGGHPAADLVEAKNQTVESLLEALTEYEFKVNSSVRNFVFCA